MVNSLKKSSICVYPILGILFAASAAHAQNAGSEQDYCWINAKTGAPPPHLVPVGTTLNPLDQNHASVPSGPTVPGRDYVRVPCPSPAASTAQTSSVGPGVAPNNDVPPLRGDLGPPPRGTYRIAEDWEVGLHGGTFFEPGTTIGVIGGSIGYRLSPVIGVELQADVGISKEKTDNGSTFRSATGISWDAYPLVVFYAPVLPNVEVFGHGGYGATRFNSSTTIFSGTTSTSFSGSTTVGTGVIGGGVQLEFDQNDAEPLHDAQRRHGANALRLSYDRLFFDNGTAGNRVTVTFIHAFGAK